MQISKQEINRRHCAIRKAMDNADVDVLVIGGNAKSDHRGALRYTLDCYIQIYEELVVIPLDGSIGYFAHDYGRVKCAEELAAVEYSDFITDLDPGKKIADYVNKFHPKRIGFYGVDSLSAKLYLSIKHHLEGLPAADFTEALNEIRMIKSEEEIILSEQSVKLNEEVFHVYLKGITQGARELDAIVEAAFFAQKNGCETQYWMVGSGGLAHCSLPLAMKRNHTWKQGESNIIVIEHTSQGGYFGEVMHYVSIGEPPVKAAEAFQVISQAQQLAGKAIKPGVTTGSIADLIDEFIMESGFYQKENTAKLLGHGQGLDIAEPPALIHGDTTIIKPGMRLNIHPQIILPDGTNIVSTDCYIVTEIGSRRLSNLLYEPVVI